MICLDDSPVVPVVRSLRDAGFRFRLSKLDLVEIDPISNVPADALLLFRERADDLRVLVGLLWGQDGRGDAGLEARISAFEAQGCGPFTLIPDAEIRVGACPSCALALEPWAIGRCWRCLLALQLVCGVSITVHGPGAIVNAA